MSEQTFSSDIAMMTAEAEYTENSVIPHYELLISQATTSGNGPKTLQALNAGLEAARSAADAAREAIAAVQAASQAVQDAYDEAAEEAATSKEYFEGE